ncbi:MAG: hypothetical protein ACE5OR_07935 [bacterium]
MSAPAGEIPAQVRSACYTDGFQALAFYRGGERIIAETLKQVQGERPRAESTGLRGRSLTRSVARKSKLR